MAFLLEHTQCVENRLLLDETGEKSDVLPTEENPVRCLSL